MAEKVKIAGELESRSMDGIIADASAIIDRNSNKRQDEINSEIWIREAPSSVDADYWEIHLPNMPGTQSRATSVKVLRNVRTISIEEDQVLAPESKEVALKNINAVGFIENQRLTQAEQVQARKNIGIEDYATAEQIHSLFD